MACWLDDSEFDAAFVRPEWRAICWSVLVVECLDFADSSLRTVAAAVADVDRTDFWASCGCCRRLASWEIDG